MRAGGAASVRPHGLAAGTCRDTEATPCRTGAWLFCLEIRGFPRGFGQNAPPGATLQTWPGTCADSLRCEGAAHFGPLNTRPSRPRRRRRARLPGPIPAKSPLGRPPLVLPPRPVPTACARRIQRCPAPRAAGCKWHRWPARGRPHPFLRASSRTACHCHRRANRHRTPPQRARRRYIRTFYFYKY